MDIRCLSCNQPDVTVRISDAPGTPGFALCGRCLLDLASGNYARLADRMLVNHDDMACTAASQRTWEHFYRELAVATDRRPITVVERQTAVVDSAPRDAVEENMRLLATIEKAMWMIADGYEQDAYRVLLAVLPDGVRRGKRLCELLRRPGGAGR